MCKSTLKSIDQLDTLKKLFKILIYFNVFTILKNCVINSSILLENKLRNENILLFAHALAKKISYKSHMSPNMQCIYLMEQYNCAC